MIIEHNVPQGSLEWHNLRSGRVTGTSLKSAFGSPKVQRTLMLSLVADRMCQNIHEDISSKAMDHGNETEGMARQTASQTLGIEFKQVGFLTSTEIDNFGISPDAVVRDDDTIVGGLEIKCPNSNKHIEYLLDNKVPNDYWHQVLAPFVLSDDVLWWYFMSYDYRNYSRPEFYIKVDRADIEDEIADTRKKLIDFLKRTNELHLELALGD